MKNKLLTVVYLCMHACMHAFIGNVWHACMHLLEMGVLSSSILYLGFLHWQRSIGGGCEL